MPSTFLRAYGPRLAARDGWRCAYCQRPLNPDHSKHIFLMFSIVATRQVDQRAAWYDDAPTVDHVRPLADGGHNTFDNMTLCCRRCNCQKQATPLPAWLAATGYSYEAPPMTTPPAPQYTKNLRDDIAVVTEILGWTDVRDDHKAKGIWYGRTPTGELAILPHFARDRAATLMLVEAMMEQGWSFALDGVSGKTHRRYRMTFGRGDWNADDTCWTFERDATTNSVQTATRTAALAAVRAWSRS